MKEGLVDEMGDQEDAVLVATRLANLSPNRRWFSDNSKSFMGVETPVESK